MDLQNLGNAELDRAIKDLGDNVGQYDTDDGMMLDNEGGTDGYRSAQEELEEALRERQRRLELGKRVNTLRQYMSKLGKDELRAVVYYLGQLVDSDEKALPEIDRDLSENPAGDRLEELTREKEEYKGRLEYNKSRRDRFAAELANKETVEPSEAAQPMGGMGKRL